MTNETIAISLINMFIAGPDVSLHGSPTVSPITVALWASDFLPPKLPLFYSLPWGEKQLAQNQQLLIIPASIAIISPLIT